MIESLAMKMALKIKSIVPDHPASIAVLKYSLSLILNAVFIIGFTLGLSVITGHTKEAAVILISYAVLRQLSGGLHLKSGIQCVFWTTATFTCMSMIQLPPMYVHIANGISLILVLFFAPSNIEKQSRIKKEHYPKLKLLSAILVSLNAVIASPILAISFLTQSLTLIRLKGGE